MQALPIRLSRLKQIVTQPSAAFSDFLFLYICHMEIVILQKSGRNKIQWYKSPPSKCFIQRRGKGQDKVRQYGDAQLPKE